MFVNTSKKLQTLIQQHNKHGQIRSMASNKIAKCQLGKTMVKVMTFDTTKKTRNKCKSISPAYISLPNICDNPKQSHSTRRTAVLNKLFMKHITDLMATGEVAPSLLGRGIEVTHIKVTPDFRLVNVYWISQNNKEEHDETEKILDVAAGHLQHELSQLRVIGRVPPINFIMNKKHAVIKEVEDKLTKVDYGEGFEPTAHIVPKNRPPILRTTISEKIKQQLEKLQKEREIVEKETIINDDDDDDDDDKIHEIQVPEMRQNVMGFDHSQVLTKVQSSIGKKNILIHKRNSDMPTMRVGSQVTEEEVSSFISTKTENNNIEDFIKKRLLNEKRKNKALCSHQSKLDAETEWFDKMNNIKFNDYYVEDEVKDEDYRECK